MALVIILQFIVIAGFGWWIYTLEKDQEDTRADVDELVGRQDAVEAHLSGNEPLDYGRHADPEPPSYRAPTWPTAA